MVGVVYPWIAYYESFWKYMIRMLNASRMPLLYYQGIFAISFMSLSGICRSVFAFIHSLWVKRPQCAKKCEYCLFDMGEPYGGSDLYVRKVLGTTYIFVEKEKKTWNRSTATRHGSAAANAGNERSKSINLAQLHRHSFIIWIVNAFRWVKIRKLQ